MAEVEVSLKNDIGVSFVFEPVDKIMSNIFRFLDEAFVKVNEVTELRLNNFRATKDAIVKYQNENKNKLNTQVRDNLDKSTAIKKLTEGLNRKIKETEHKSKATEDIINGKALEVEELENKQKALLSDKGKVVENLKKTLKAYSVAIAWYESYLSMRIAYRVKEKRFDITFLNRKNREREYTVAVSQSADTFLFDGTDIAMQPQFMAKLCQERRKFSA